MSAAPKLRGLFEASVKKQLAIGSVFAVACTAVYYVLVNKPRKEAYAKFYQEYDGERDFLRMRAAGVFTGIKSDGSNIEEW